MAKNSGQIIGRAVLLVSVFILLGVGLSATSSPNEEVLNDTCIRCHVAVYNKGMNSLYKHRPCFERQCIVCHLVPGSGVTTPNQGAAAPTLTGLPVAVQGNQWRKTMFFASAGLQIKHEVTLVGLEESESFRFRIVLSDSPKPGAGQQRASRWFGLIPAEVKESSALPEHTLEISRPAANFILVPNIRRLGKAVVIRWQSFSESFGWVELQALAGISPQQTVTTSAQEQTAGPGQEPHPLLVTTEFATIDLCYSCHPESGLGSSHPVRIYTKGKETLIPATLPTAKDGMLTCVTCHDPHGGENKALVRELIVTKLCVACHYTFKQTSRHTMF
ncbi:MAG: hypothetical protein KKD73_00795 [Proteobacteria bacterium]|nr:hypothetical protein [Pseudomonadota bacterium]MBU1641005.1 hypothetical protein [Pseudomonadota bacterium]